MREDNHSGKAQQPSQPDLEPAPADTIRIFNQELSFARTMARPTWATYGLLITIAVVFLLTLVVHRWLSALLAPLDLPYEAIVLLGAKDNAAIEAGEHWRLGTHILLHGNGLHLLVNAYALYVLGTILERLYGARRYLVLFFLSGLGGAIASFLFTPAPSVGASGAIFGLLGAAVVFGVKFGGLLPARMRRVLTAGLLPWVVINIVIGMTFEQIDNAAHMGGLVVGSLVALLLGTPLLHKRSLVTGGVQWLILAIALCYMAWAMGAFAGLTVGLARLQQPEAILEGFRMFGILR